MNVPGKSPVSNHLHRQAKGCDNAIGHGFIANQLHDMKTAGKYLASNQADRVQLKRALGVMVNNPQAQFTKTLGVARVAFRHQSDVLFQPDNNDTG